LISPAAASEGVAANALMGRAPLGNLPVLQCWTTETHTEFKVLRPLGKIYHYQVVGPHQEKFSVIVSDEFIFSQRPSFSVDHISVSGLELGKEYKFLIRDDRKLLDERYFSALDLSSASARIAVISCMHDAMLFSQRPMWSAVAKSQPDLLLFVGDVCYADFLSNSHPTDLWRRHCQSRQLLDAYKLKRLIPSLAIWDDHDFGVNNSDERFRYKQDSLRIFESFFGSRSNDRHFKGPGTSRVAHAFGMRIAMMDDRFFRAPKGTKNGSHWGSEQESFLKNELKSATLPTLLCNGSQFYGGYLGKESYEGNHPESFTWLQETLRSVESPVMFCSGDVHFSEVMGIEQDSVGYSTWELTSSSIHSIALPWTYMKEHNPRRLKVTNQHNFILLETHAESSTRLSFNAKSLGKWGEIFGFSETLTR